MHSVLLSLIASVALASAKPVIHAREVIYLDQAAVAEAHQRDANATRALSNINIKTSDGRCLSVDQLSGDSRANLTPIQVTQCGAADGQEWDIVTAGRHISTPQSMLVVSTTTGACLNFDPRRAAGDQVLLFSCGGRADGSGEETDSQIFHFSQPDFPQSLQPQNAPGKCLAVNNNVLDISDCSSGDAAQEFIFGTPTPSASPTTPGTGNQTSGTVTQPTANGTVTQPTANGTVTQPTASGTVTQPTASGTVTQPTATGATTKIDPEAVKEAQQRDDSAVRAVSSTKIRTSRGQCLSVDPLAGDFRMNLIPVVFADCANSTEWDLITSGKHNDGSGGEATLLVSTATQGCISFDARRELEDQVNLFSCGGRADGSGQTNQGQLFPFAGGNSFAIAPVSEGNKTCLIVGQSRLVAGTCEDSAALFTLDS